MSFRVGIIQSNYVPWRGYFDFIDECDAFIFLDDVQYTRRDWRSRNQIKSKTGLTWISVPVSCTFGESLINNAQIDYSWPWVNKHLENIRNAYSRAPHFERYFKSFSELLRPEYRSISELNQALISWLCQELRIKTPLLNASDFQAAGGRNDRLVNLVLAAGGTEYLTGPAALAYLDHEAFSRKGITVLVKEYSYPDYPQCSGDFMPAVSVLDLLFNTGDAARDFLKSTPPWKPLGDDR